MSRELHAGLPGVDARIAINGFGRMGRTIFRAMPPALRERVVAINDIAECRVLGHLLKWDSTAGRFEGVVEWEENAINVDGHRIEVSQERDPVSLRWKKLGIDAVIESTGFFIRRDDAAKHLAAGADKVLVTAGAIEVDANVLFGINHQSFDPEPFRIIGAGSPPSHCLAPVTKVLDDTFGIRRGTVSAIAGMLTDQRLLDMPGREFRRCRSAPENIIPTGIDYATSHVSRAIPHLMGKLMGGSLFRVPVPIGGMIDFSVELEHDASKDEINAALKEASQGALKGILGYTGEPLVLRDMVGNPQSAIADGLATESMGNLIKVVAFYDNEWGYANRMIDTLGWLLAK